MLAGFRGVLAEARPQKTIWDNTAAYEEWVSKLDPSDVTKVSLKKKDDYEMAGWGHGIRSGDYLLLSNESKSTRYQVVSIRYCSDPSDMWFATVKFAPRI